MQPFLDISSSNICYPDVKLLIVPDRSPLSVLDLGVLKLSMVEMNQLEYELAQKLVGLPDSSLT